MIHHCISNARFHNHSWVRTLECKNSIQISPSLNICSTNIRKTNSHYESIKTWESLRVTSSNYKSNSFSCRMLNILCEFFLLEPNSNETTRFLNLNWVGIVDISPNSFNIIWCFSIFGNWLFIRNNIICSELIYSFT